MSLLSRHIELNEAHGILICPVHECVVLPNSIKKHFDKNHRKELTVIQRAQLQEEADKLSDSISLKTEYSQFRFAKPDGSPLHEIPYLGLHSSLACRLCDYICSDSSAKKTMKGHLRERHKIYERTRGASVSTLTQNVRSIYTQRYFHGATNEAEGLNILRYFEVVPSATADTASSVDRNESENEVSIDRNTPAGEETPYPDKHNNHNTSVLNRLQTQLDKATSWAREEREERLATVPHSQSVQTNPWLAYTRFLEILPTKWDEVLEYMAIPTPRNEPALYFLYCTTKSMVRTWQNSTAKTSRYARIRVMQEDVSDVPLVPLETYQHLALQHALPLQKIFIFFYRVLVQKRHAPDQLRLSPTQQDSWSQIVKYVNSVEDGYPEVEAHHTRICLDPLEQLCYAFWLSLVEQTSLDDDFELPFVISTAFLVVSNGTKRVREVYNFATDITALKKMIRLASMQKFREHFVDPVRNANTQVTDGAITHLEASSLMEEQMNATPKQQSREETNRTVANQFKAWVYDYLTTEYPTPMNWLINTGRYLSRFRYGENLDAFVNWNGHTVTVRSVRTSLSKYTSMVHNEYEHASSLLCKLAFVSQRSALPSIPWDDLIEDPTNTIPSFSIFSPESSLLKPQAGFIQEQLLHSHRVGRRVLIDNLQNPRQIQQYLELVQEFLGTLLGLVHFTSGQPARGTELLSVHHENPSNGTLRNIFLYNGLVAVVPQYHKGYNRDKSLKVIYRFLPRPIGSLLVWYLWLIRPFYALIQHQAPQGIREAHIYRATSTLLWPDQKGTQYTTSKLLSQVVQHATEKWMGTGINISTLRHLIIAFGRKIDGMDRIPTELSKEEVDEIIDTAEAEEREMQAGHSATTASAIYALDISQVFAKKFDRAEGQFKVSAKWHNALGFDEKEAFNELYPAPLKPPAKPRDIADRLQCNYKRLLRENFGKEAVFRPQQEKVIRAIMGGETVVAYIAGTGAGKSITFLLPACYPGYGQTIIIVPLAALRHDIVTQCHKHSIRASVWKDGHCDQSASIILATPECIRQPSFVEMTHRLSSTGALERIVVDEFHYVLLPDHTYRPHLLELRKLTQFGVRLTLLSATVPFQEQVDAFRLLSVPTDTVPFRVATSRPNLAWQVKTISLSSNRNALDMANYVKSQCLLYPKVLVYVDITATADLLSAELQCSKYHGKMTLEERQSAQDNFCTSSTGILVATTAYLVGVHVPNIRAVLWFGMPDHLISLVQGGGRGGRDGEPCLVRLVLSPQIPSTHYTKAEPACRSMVDAFVQSDTDRPICRRRVLGEYFDNDTERLTCRTNEESCDVCDERIQRQRDSHTERAGGPAEGSEPRGPAKRPIHVPLSTPVRSVTAASTQPFATPATSTSHPASSPLDYELSVPRFSISGHSATDAINLTGSPSVPRRLPYSPRKKRQLSSTWTPSSQSSSPFKGTQGNRDSSIALFDQSRKPYPRESSHDDNETALLDTSPTTFRTARQNRQLDFNAEILGDANAARNVLFHQELPATQTFWITHCVVCFGDHHEYKHPRSQCDKLIGSLVGQYRQKMNHQWGRGMCWSCLMPANCCPKWSPSGTGQTVQHPDHQKQCIDKRAILDTWACLWDKCPGARAHWVEKIRTVQADFDSANDSHFRKYFQQVVPYGNDYKANRLCLDVNWLTQTFFLHGHCPQELLTIERSNN